MEIGSSQIGAIISILLICSGFFAFTISIPVLKTEIIGRNVWASRKGGNGSVYVNESVQVVNITINAAKIEVTHFNTHHNPVSIVINTTFVPHQELLRYSNVSGTNITGFTYPEGEPPQGLGSWSRGSFYLFFYWEKKNTNISFEYLAWLEVIHADNWVTVTEPGHFALAGTGYFLLSIGILVGVVTLCTYTRTKQSN